MRVTTTKFGSVEVCSEEKWVSLYIFAKPGDLTPEERRDFTIHLLTCGLCAEKMSATREALARPVGSS